MNELSDLEDIRTRPAMYIGRLEQWGIQRLVFEAIENAVDQFFAGKASRIDVQIKDESVRVADDGEGYPMDCFDEHGTSLGMKYLTQRHTTNTADGHVPHIHGFGAGGLFALNALSRWLKVSSVRNGKRFIQEFCRGSPASGMVTTSCLDPSGTLIEFKIDTAILKDPEIDENLTRKKLQRLSYLFPGLTVSFQGEIHRSSKGLLDLIENEMSIAGEPAFSFSTRLGSSIVSAAAVGHSEGETGIVSFANGGVTLNTSSHVTGLKRALRRAKWRPAAAAISVVLDAPRYAGPTGQQLNVSGLDKKISDMLAVVIKQFKSGEEDLA